MKIFAQSKPVYIYVFVFLFIVLMIVEFKISANYVSVSKADITSNTKQSIKEMIREKEYTTFDISQIIAHNNNLINIMKSGEYGKLHKEDVFKISKYYTKYRNMDIYIIDKNGIYVHSPLKKSAIEKNTPYENSIIKALLFSKRTKRINNYHKEEHSFKGICVGKSGIIFKGVTPIYDYFGNILGLVEVNTHFHSIAKELKINKIYSALVVEKRYAKYMSYSPSWVNIDKYPVLVMDTDKKPIINLIKKYGIREIINTKGYRYLTEKPFFSKGYYVVSVPIKNNNKETLGYYLGFIYDTYGLTQKEDAMRIILGVMFLLFAGMSYMGYKYKSINTRLITSLNKRVEIQTRRNIELLYIDTLTGVFNKIKFDKDIQDIPKETNIVMFDIKNFSKFNSIYGFKTGDKILKIVAKRVKNVIGKSLYRIHADEFVFISDDYENDIKKIKEKFIKEPIDIQDINIKLRLSFAFGVCQNNAEDVLSKVSIALKEAKQSIYKEFTIYKEQKRDTDFVRFNAMLYDAIFYKKESRIVPYFQGIRNNKTGLLNKYEALARLVSKGKIYTPFFFLDIAKSSGFMYEITKIMMDKAMGCIKSSDIDISLNITEEDLNKGYLEEYITTLSKRYRIKTDRITLELLEGITSSGTKNNIEKLRILKNMGIKLALDDFGVEYSNFERIAELDIDFIKIDAKYIKNLTTSLKSRKIVKAITDFAHSINTEVVAEFVDNKETQKIVEDFGIEYSQGYLFSIPSETIKTSQANS